MNFQHLSRSLFAIAIIMSIAGCASRRAEKVSSFISPEIGTVATRGLGENLLTEGTGVIALSLIISDSGNLDAYSFPKGEYQFGAENEKQTKYLSEKSYFLVMKVDGSVCSANGKCGKVNYTIEPRLVKKSADAFQQTLIYSGRIGNKITLGYREFSSNSARPAFNNDVAYDLDDSKILGYKGARIEVVKATNTEITYKVISGFK